MTISTTGAGRSRWQGSSRTEAGRMELKLQGRTALITGASRGIGEAIAGALAAEGCHLTLTARDENKLREMATELVKSHSVKIATHVFDLSKLDSIRRLAEVGGDCDILVNNAGAIPRGSLDEVSPQAWREACDIKVYGYIDMTRYIRPRMNIRSMETLNII